MKNWLLLGMLIFLVVPFISAGSLSISIDSDTHYALNLYNGDSQNVQFSVNAEQYSCVVNCIWKLYDSTNSRTIDSGSDITKSNTPFYKTFTLTAPTQGSGTVKYLFSANCNEITGEGNPGCNSATQGTAEWTTLLYYSAPEVTCSPSWDCGAWSTCVNSNKVRICDDGCGKTKTESENCCIPSWSCSQWSNADQACGTRTCNDLNGCGITVGEPQTSKFCPTQCYPNWNCNQWSNVNQQCGTRICTDTNRCGTNQGQPITSKSCPVQCVPSWSCSQWSDVNQQCGVRTCTDVQRCGNDAGKPMTSKSCPVVQPEVQKIQIDSYPIIFVHGFNSDDSTFKEMETRLIQDTTLTTKTARILSYPKITDCLQLSEYGIRQHAEKLSQEIDKILSETGQTKVVIIAHSMGGLTARYYLGRLDGWKNNKIDKLIMLGTPNHGSTTAQLGTILSCHKQEIEDLTSGSKFLNDLNSIGYGNGEYYSIYSSYDKVSPPDTAWLEPYLEVGLDKINNFEISDASCSHGNLPKPSLCDPAYKQIITLLNKDSNTKVNNLPIPEVNSAPSVTGKVVSSDQKVCVRRFLWIFRCIEWDTPYGAPGE